ncbi:hypothetical protein BDY19DRAFT_1003800 [Irpex rosettiformis]|uniref:Uncharacterized protein n=1 Tax=Irpex rosettiformis TaxID=378272 RepID=A0ACB8U6T8_9APHY|nr:hypothetical protein BDY19DRAFT_1003800 [Irpex rosettiformis]
MPVFRNVPSIRRSRRLSNRPPPADPEYEDYDLEELELQYPTALVARATSAASATHITHPSTSTPSTIELHSEAESDKDAPAFLPPRASHGRKRKEGHIPRPRNAFMFFRSDLCRSGRIHERDHRQISRIAGHLWQKMSDELKMPFHHLAAIEKQQHKARYPGYKYAPIYKTKSGKKRTRKDASSEVKHCKQLAELLISGVQGDALEQAAVQLGEEVDDESSYVGPQRSVRSRRAAQRVDAPYSRRPAASVSPRLSTSADVEVHTSADSEPAPSTVVKSSTEASPQVAYTPDSFVPTDDIPTLTLEPDTDQVLSLELFQPMLTYYPPEMQPALDGSNLCFSSPSSSTTTITPEISTRFDFHDNSDVYSSDSITFTNPWHRPSADSADFPLFDRDVGAFGNSEVSPLSYPQPIDDLLSQYLNDEFTL